MVHPTCRITSEDRAAWTAAMPVDDRQDRRLYYIILSLVLVPIWPYLYIILLLTELLPSDNEFTLYNFIKANPIILDAIMVYVHYDYT